MQIGNNLTRSLCIYCCLEEANPISYVMVQLATPIIVYTSRKRSEMNRVDKLMRKIKSLVLILVYTATLLAACAPERAGLTLTSLEKMSDSYTLEKAKADHVVVYEDMDITSGQEVWDRFMVETTKGESASVRLAFYYTPQAQLKDDKPVFQL